MLPGWAGRRVSSEQWRMVSAPLLPSVFGNISPGLEKPETSDTSRFATELGDIRNNRREHIPRRVIFTSITLMIWGSRATAPPMGCAKFATFLHFAGNVVLELCNSYRYVPAFKKALLAGAPRRRRAHTDQKTFAMGPRIGRNCRSGVFFY